MYKILPWRFRAVFLPPRACAKSGWLEVDQELDMSWPTFATQISVLKLQGSFLQRSAGNTQRNPESSLQCAKRVEVIAEGSHAVVNLTLAYMCMDLNVGADVARVLVAHHGVLEHDKS